MGVCDIRQHCTLDAAGERLLEQVMQHFGLSVREYDRICNVAHTIADLDNALIPATHPNLSCGYQPPRHGSITCSEARSRIRNPSGATNCEMYKYVLIHYVVNVRMRSI